MFKILLSPFATQDISDTAYWYKGKRPDLGKLFTSKVRNSISIIGKNPKSFAIRYDDVRTIEVEDFPYLVHYMIFEEEKSSLFSQYITRQEDL